MFILILFEFSEKFLYKFLMLKLLARVGKVPFKEIKHLLSFLNVFLQVFDQSILCIKKSFEPTLIRDQIRAHVTFSNKNHDKYENYFENHLSFKILN